MTNKKDKMIEILETLDGISTELRFIKFLSNTTTKIVVRYAGHGEAGSYVYSTSVMPSYVKALEKITNRRVDVVHNTRDGGVGYDAYDCTIHLNEIISSTAEKRNTVGKIIYGEGYHAFRVCVGRVWAMCYGIMERATDSKFVEVTGLGLSKRDSEIVTYNDKEIFKKLDIKPSFNKHFKGHNTDCNRTYYSATFDLYIDEQELSEIFLNLSTEAHNYNLELNNREYRVKKHYFKTPEYQSEHIMYTYTNDMYNTLGPRVGHLPTIEEKSKVNEDYTFQCWDVGSTLKQFEKDGKLYKKPKIIKFTYSLTEGPIYGIVSVEKLSDDTSVYMNTTLNHIEMNDYFKPQYEKNISVDYYNVFFFPGFITKEETNSPFNIEGGNTRSIFPSVKPIFKELHNHKSDYRNPQLKISENHNGKYITRFLNVEEKVIVQNVFNAFNLKSYEKYDLVAKAKDHIKYHISEYRKFENELSEINKIIRHSDKSIKKRLLKCAQDIERDMNNSKNLVSEDIQEIKESRKVIR